MQGYRGMDSYDQNAIPGSELAYTMRAQNRNVLFLPLEARLLKHDLVPKADSESKGRTLVLKTSRALLVHERDSSKVKWL
jgi:hypothetical protein